MHIYNKTNKEIVAMASFRPARISNKKTLSRERGFRFTSKRFLLHRKERNTLLVESTHLASGQLNSVALTVDCDPLVLQVGLRNLAGSVHCM
jgi:hypothetical protein